MVDVIGCGGILSAFIGALFAFVAYGTMGWTIQNYVIEGGTIVYDYKLYQGLLTYRQELTITNDATNTVTYSEDTYDTNCDRLSSTQCDYLGNAQNAGATAVAFAVMMLLVYALLACVGRMDWKVASVVIYVATIVLAIVFAVSAFTAVGQWKELIEDIESSTTNTDIDYNLSYSWYLMIFAGIFAIACAFGSLHGLCAKRRADNLDKPLNSA